MTPTIRALAERYSATVAARDGISHERLPGGGVRQPLDRADLGLRATALAHELAAEVAKVIAAEPPESTAAPRCGSCGQPMTVEGCPLCVTRGGR